ncbi:hypothetical protein EIK77_004856 [Talaromyces pinophilus]|nr:hypothetical protein EIK77_004856 [Talaromyces pinophilus]PCG99866.1 Hypothetical protein PENO1_051120 [Penicillium occitanis (nom. inval.)]PCH00705.1 hypothetical protein PENOC_052020 [Penicillium occitanis (nom. inval.)]
MEVLDFRSSLHPEFSQCHDLRTRIGCYEGQLGLAGICWAGNSDGDNIKGLPEQGQKSIDCQSVTFRLALFNAYASVNEIISQNAEPAGYGTPPPPYTHVHDDLPPEYSALPAFAEAKPLVKNSAPLPNNAGKSRNSKSNPASSIDFESTHGFRQHGKKQKAKLAAKKAVSGSSGGDGGNSGKKNDETIDAPGGSGVGGSAGGDDGGDGGDKNNDGWGEGTSSSKKKKSKKEEEEEEERKKKEAEEAAAAGTAANNLSWADDLDNNNDDSWAGFTSVGKKDNKKKNSVSRVYAKQNGHMFTNNGKA